MLPVIGEWKYLALSYKLLKVLIPTNEARDRMRLCSGGGGGRKHNVACLRQKGSLLFQM